ncbi:hypothetical protein A0H81_06546 [Grifola frondosa]|uniref:Uncharacterized protein n=1 Tax=Grifola frondosa TaxID=5627 RepID=A0A1C7MB24_GRIFR|nr:hypothetical protein A0H81_06546 [Grifola frondosa]
MDRSCIGREYASSSPLQRSSSSLACLEPTPTVPEARSIAPQAVGSTVELLNASPASHVISLMVIEVHHRLLLERTGLDTGVCIQHLLQLRGRRRRACASHMRASACVDADNGAVCNPINHFLHAVEARTGDRERTKNAHQGHRAAAG